MLRLSDSQQPLLPVTSKPQQLHGAQGQEIEKKTHRPRDVHKLMLLELTALLRVDHHNVVGVKAATISPRPAIIFEDCGNQCTLRHWIRANVLSGDANLKVTV